MPQTFISQLEWRFATKKFDQTRKVKSSDLKKILKAIRFAPTSMGLQPFRVFVITDEKTKQLLRPLSHDQAQVTDCAYLLVFCIDTDLAGRAERYLALLKENNPDIQLDANKKTLDGFVTRKSGPGVEAWAARQTYIAFGFALSACAELAIDSCPMEGFDVDKINEALKLPAHLKTVCFLAIGYRAAGPTRPKFRFPEEYLFIDI